MKSRAGALVAAALLAASCSTGDDALPPTTRATESADTEEVVDSDDAGTGLAADEPADTEVAEEAVVALNYSIVFEDLGGGVDGGWLTVPRDYGDPQGETLDLWVTRHRTDDDGRAGILLVNNGGPGVPASSMATNVRGWLEDPLIERFDVVSWDPRGTGQSGGSVDCIGSDEYDTFFASSDITPDTDEERDQLVELAQEFADACIAAVGDTLSHIGTNNSARDMDAIRQALGEEQASYLGYSYGSELGAVWATLFPDTVRAAVLDGAAHPDAEGLEPVKQQLIGFENVFNTFLAACSANSDCAFHNDGDAEGAYDALIAQLDESSIPTVAGRPELNQEVAINGVVQAMYSDRRWPALERALADAADGDGSGLLAFHDNYFQRDPDTGEYSNLLEAFQAITCADDPDRLSPEEADAEGAELIGVAPRLFPYTTASYTCHFFPPAADPRIEITGDDAGPIVVIGTTGDASTPLASSEAMASALEDGTLLIVEANQHTAYRSSSCVNDVVHDYLIWLEVPEPDTRCT